MRRLSRSGIWGIKPYVCAFASEKARNLEKNHICKVFKSQNLPKFCSPYKKISNPTRKISGYFHCGLVVREQTGNLYHSFCEFMGSIPTRSPSLNHYYRVLSIWEGFPQYLLHYKWNLTIMARSVKLTIKLSSDLTWDWIWYLWYVSPILYHLDYWRSFHWFHNPYCSYNIIQSNPV